MRTEARQAAHAPLTVYYDGACPLCAGEIAVIRRLDRDDRIDFRNIADRGVDCPGDRAAMLARFHAREDGVLLSGAAAFAAMWRAIPILRPIGRVAKNPLLLGLLEGLYRLFLKVRPALAATLNAVLRRQ